MDDITRTKMERIYGLLWNVRTDRTTFFIDKPGQASGIEWANKELMEKHAMTAPRWLKQD